MAYLSNEEQPNLKACNSNDQSLALKPTEHYSGSRWDKASPIEVDNIITEKNVNVNFHHWCLTPENFTKFEPLGNFWDVLATNHDWHGLEFISMMEAKNYPIWAVQYHPEKNAFEWTPKWLNIPHSRDAVYSAAFHAAFFVQVRKCAIIM